MVVGFSHGDSSAMVTKATAYGMEISAEKTKLVIINTSEIKQQIKASGQKLETVISFKYWGSVVSDEGSKSLSCLCLICLLPLILLTTPFFCHVLVILLVYLTLSLLGSLPVSLIAPKLSL